MATEIFASGDGNIRQRRRKYSPAATEMSAGTGRQAPWRSPAGGRLGKHWREIAAFAKKAVEQNKFHHSRRDPNAKFRRDPFEKIMGWLLPRTGK